MLVAFSTILWKFLDENNYADKNDQRKFERKNGYHHIATLEDVRAQFLFFNHVIICPSEIHYSSSNECRL